MFRVIITDEAEQDMQQIFEWWRDNRSPAQAAEWFEKILVEIKTLRQMPERCVKAPEAEKTGLNIRQLLFTIGHRITHRIVYLVGDDTVTVLRVRHTAQDSLPDDFPSGERRH